MAAVVHLVRRANGSSSSSPTNEARYEGLARHLPPDGLIAIAWCGFALACGLTALRCYIRISETRRLWSDDYWMLVALAVLGTNALLQTLQTPSLYYLVAASTGSVPAGEALLAEGNVYVRYEFVVIALFWTATWSVKSSFLALYWRLFQEMPRYRRMWWAVMIFTALAYVGCWIASVWTCHPPSTYFQFGQCSKPIDTEGSTISISYSTAVDILSDIMIMALPLRLLPDLQVNRRQKIGLTAIFGIGCVVIAIAVVRLTQIVGKERADPVGLALWGIVESSISVVVGSLPALKSFLGRAIQRTLHHGSMPLRNYGTPPHKQHSSGRSMKLFSNNHGEVDVVPLQNRSDTKVSSDDKWVRGKYVVEQEYY